MSPSLKVCSVKLIFGKTPTQKQLKVIKWSLVVGNFQNFWYFSDVTTQPNENCQKVQKTRKARISRSVAEKPCKRSLTPSRSKNSAEESPYQVMPMGNLGCFQVFVVGHCTKIDKNRSKSQKKARFSSFSCWKSIQSFPFFRHS